MLIREERRRVPLANCLVSREDENAAQVRRPELLLRGVNEVEELAPIDGDERGWVL